MNPIAQMEALAYETINLKVAKELEKGKKLKDIVSEIECQGILTKTEKEQSLVKVMSKIMIINACKTLKKLISTEEQRQEFGDLIIEIGEELKAIKGVYNE